jgi:preprotein translocase subunit YajC
MVMLTVMILMSILSGRGEKKRRRTMLQGLTKRDRVQTTAGIIGTVVEMKGDEIVLKVDEASNTRIRFAKSAVQQVLRSSGSSATDSSADAGEDAGQQAGHEKETVTS